MDASILARALHTSSSLGSGLETGNLGDHKHIGDGVWEARLAFGPGYRLYFGRSGRDLVLLLLGGDKGSQGKDIKKAREFWTQYREELRHGEAK